MKMITKQEFENYCQTHNLEYKIKKCSKIAAGKIQTNFSDGIFMAICESGYLETAKWLYSIGEYHDIEEVFMSSILFNQLLIVIWLSDKINIRMINSETISDFCVDEHVYRWFFDFCSEKNINVNIDDHFLYDISFSFDNNLLFISTKLECVKWIVETYKKLNGKEIDIHYYDDMTFINACKYNCFDVAVYLYELGANINARNNEAFVVSCLNGNFEIVKWLYSLGKININDIGACDMEHLLGFEIKKNKAFKNCCIGGHLEIAKWLYYLCENNKPLEKSELIDSFICSCQNGHIEIAEWLFDYCKNFIDNTDLITAFIRSCKSGNKKLIDWIYGLCKKPLDNKYILEAFQLSLFSENKEIINWIYSIVEKPIEHSELISYLKTYIFHEHKNIDVLNFIYYELLNKNIEFNELEELFKEQCKFNNIEIATWICSLNEDFSIEIIGGNIFYKIKTIFSDFIDNNTSLIKVIKKINCKVI